MNLKNYKIKYKKYKYLIQVFLLVKATLSMMEHNLEFQTLYYTLKRIGYTEKIISWKSNGLSAEKLTTPTTTTDNSLSPSIK